MNKKNLEDNLKSIRLRQVSPGEKEALWVNIVRANIEGRHKKSLSILSIINFKKHMIGALIALLILGGGGGVVVASNASVPGDTLYGLDLAVEKAKVNFASSVEKKDELRVKFADERIAEVKSKSEVKGSENTADIDLSAATITEIEADVFTNETTVKIEADDRHYGFVTTKKTRGDVVAEIAAKYSLTVTEVDAMIDFETEDRASRADDKEFLNSSNTGRLEIKSEKERRDFEMSLESLSDMDGLSAESQARLNAAINEIRLILEANPNSKIKIENGEFKIEVKENGEIKFESEDGDDSDDDSDDKDEDEDSDDEDGNKGHGNDDDGEDDDNRGKNTGVNVNAGGAVNSGSQDDSDDSDDDGDNEDDSNDDNDEDDDNSSNDEDDSNEEDEDEDNSGSGNDEDEEDDNSGSDDDDDDDNSGHGN